jgi:transcriptional regulator with XRE-family HTH domain
MIESEQLKRIVAEIKFKRGLRQKEIADSLGITATYLSDLLSGRLPVSDKVQVKISELYSDCLTSVPQVAAGDSNTQISGNGNNLIDSAALSKAFDEIASHRALLEKTLSMMEKKDEQIDRLITIIETKHDDVITE